MNNNMLSIWTYTIYPKEIPYERWNDICIENRKLDVEIYKVTPKRYYVKWWWYIRKTMDIEYIDKYYTLNEEDASMSYHFINNAWLIWR